MAIRLKYDPVGGPIIASYATGMGRNAQRRRKEAQAVAERNFRENQYRQRRYQDYLYSRDLQDRRHRDYMARIEAMPRGKGAPPEGAPPEGDRREPGILDGFFNWWKGITSPDGPLGLAEPLPEDARRGSDGIDYGELVPDISVPDELLPKNIPDDITIGPTYRPPVPRTIAPGEQDIANEIAKIDEAIRRIENGDEVDRNHPDTKEKYEELKRRRERLMGTLTPEPEPSTELSPEERRAEERKEEEYGTKQIQDAYDFNDKQRERQQRMIESGATPEQAKEAFPLRDIDPLLFNDPRTPETRPHRNERAFRSGAMSPQEYAAESYQLYLDGAMSLEEYQRARQLADRKREGLPLPPMKTEEPAEEATETPTPLPEMESALKSGSMSPDEYMERIRKEHMAGSLSVSEYSRATILAKRQDYINTINSIREKYRDVVIDDVRDIPDSDDRKAYRTAMRELENLDKEARGESTVITVP
jgi:hypothetical protein